MFVTLDMVIIAQAKACGYLGKNGRPHRAAFQIVPQTAIRIPHYSNR